jgi:hypothetical protein
MVIVLLGWLYVVMMFALAQGSVLGTVVVLLFLGVCPLLLLGWVLRQRRRMRRLSGQTRHDA